MRQRDRLKASRKKGSAFTVSARALKVATLNSLSGLLHQRGTKPHRIGTRPRLPSFKTIVSMVSVGRRYNGAAGYAAVLRARAGTAAQFLPKSACRQKARTCPKSTSAVTNRPGSGLPPLSIVKELRRMKQQDEQGKFERFEADHRETIWDAVLKPRREAEGDPKLEAEELHGRHGFSTPSPENSVGEISSLNSYPALKGLWCWPVRAGFWLHHSPTPNPSAEFVFALAAVNTSGKFPQVRGARRYTQLRWAKRR